MALVESTEQHPPTEGLRMTPSALAEFRERVRDTPRDVRGTAIGTLDINAIPRSRALQALDRVGPGIDAWHTAQQDADGMSRATHSRTQIRNARRAAAELLPAAEAEWATATTAMATFEADMQAPTPPAPVVEAPVLRSSTWH